MLVKFFRLALVGNIYLNTVVNVNKLHLVL